MATDTSLSDVFPLGSRLNERGRLEVGGCDTIELAREFGTPAYVVAEDDLRARARAFLQAGRDAGHEDFHVVFASKAFPCTAVLALFAAEGLWCDVASGGELHLALNAGFAPERIVLHGNAKSEAELRMALERRRRADRGRQLRRDRPARAAARRRRARRGRGRRRRQPVLVRVTPDVRGDTHEKISTGQADSKFGFAMRPGAARRSRALAGDRRARRCRACTRTSAPSCSSSSRFARRARELAKLGEFPVWDLGGGLGVRYTERAAAAADDRGVRRRGRRRPRARTACGADQRLLIEPGRALSANAGVTLYTVESVKQNVSRWVAVDGGMSDNMRPMLYGARYEAHVADRFGGATSACSRASTASPAT